MPFSFPLNAAKSRLIAVLCVTLAVRVGFLLFIPAAFSTDPDGYWRLAENIARHGTLGHEDAASAYRSPVYPLLLAPCAMLGEFFSDGAARISVGVLHVALGVATVWLVYALGIRLGFGPWSAAAALLAAFDPILLKQSALIMTETAAAFLAAAALFQAAVLIARATFPRAVLLGLTLATAALCRPVFLPWLALGLPLLFFLLKPQAGESSRDRPGPSRLRIVFAVAAAAFVVLAPWAVRNQIHFGRPILTTTHGGYTFYLANNPWFYDYLAKAPPGSVWDAQELGPRWHRSAENATPQSELADDREAYAAAFETIRARPGMFCYSCLVRVGRLWAVAPHQVRGGWLAAIWYCAEYLLIAVGVWAICRAKTARSPFWLWALLLAVCVTAVHTIYWTDMRMRAPLVPVIALTAAAGLSFLLSKPGRDPAG